MCSWIVLLLFCLFGALSAEYSFLAKTLGSNMVLQRDTVSSLYGFSSRPSSYITASLSLKVYRTTAAEVPSGNGGYFWKVDLDPMAGGFEAYSINITSSVGEYDLLENVLFGDVFLCSGQSNMQLAMAGIFDNAEEIAAAAYYPNIRVFSVGQDSTFSRETAQNPLDDLYSLSEGWTVGSSAGVNSFNAWSFFSAVCWEFGVNLYWGVLAGKVPIGLISSNWGGTLIEAWTPQSTITTCYATVMSVKDSPVGSPHEQHEGEGYSAKREMSSGEEFDPNQPAVLYNTMIYPFRHMAIIGSLWYQGESNMGSTIYPCLQEGMLRAWRELFGENFGFLYTQLSAWTAGGMGYLPSFRTGQLSILSLPAHWRRAAMITAADLGDPDSPLGDIHPRNKTEVGRRLSLAAATALYGVVVPHMGPFVLRGTILSTGAVRLHFEPQSCGKGIHLEAPQVCPLASMAQVGGCGYIKLTYANQAHDTLAKAIVSGKYLVDLIPLTIREDLPVGVAYCQGDYPLMTIYNSWNTPLLPFTLALQ